MGFDWKETKVRLKKEDIPLAADRRTTALGKAAWEHWGRHGVPVFPCSSTKRPLTPSGFKDAVADKDGVYALFAQYPTARYIGAVTGKLSGFFAIDFDLYKEGQAEAVKRELEEDGLLPPTRVHTTKSGGLHYLYGITDIDVRNGVPFNGIEIRGTGGYIIVPPSVGYEVQDDTPIADAPKALIDKIKSGIKKFNTSPTDHLEDVILDGSNFHEALLILSARRQEDNEDRAETLDYLKKLVNASVASSPEHPRHGRWQALVRDEGKELSRIVSSAYKKFNTSGADRRLREAKRLKERSEGSDDKESESGSEQSNTSSASNEPSGFARSYDIANIMSGDHDKPYVLHPIMMEGDVIVLSADPKAGKSLFAMTLALHMGAGMSLGKMVPVRETGQASNVPVIYFALEGQSALRQRIVAWLKETGVSESDVAVHVVEESLDFTSRATRKYITDNVVELERRYMDKGYGPIGLIVVDTLTKAMPGKDQNKVEDTSEVFDIVRHLRNAGINACVMYIHHNRRDGEMPRGSSNIMAEPDTVLRLKKLKDRVVEGELSTTVEVGVYIARAIDDTFTHEFAVKEVDIGKNTQGIMRKSAVLKHVEDIRQAHSEGGRGIVEATTSKPSKSKDRKGFYDWLAGVIVDTTLTSAELEVLMQSSPALTRYYRSMLKEARSKNAAWKQIVKDNPYKQLILTWDEDAKSLTGALDAVAGIQSFMSS